MQVECGNQDVVVDSRIIKVGVISTGGLVKPRKIIFKQACKACKSYFFCEYKAPGGSE